ncbi:hypothetical protein ACVWZV_009378 [Bradyrhizobium sp. GM5.1]
MIMGGEQPAQMMSPAARLHPDDARRKLRHKSYQRLAPNLTPHHDRTRRVEPDDAADILAKINTKHCNIISVPPSVPSATLRRRCEGRPFHKA